MVTAIISDETKVWGLFVAWLKTFYHYYSLVETQTKFHEIAEDFIAVHAFF